MTDIALINGQIVLPNQVVNGQALVVRAGKMAELVPANALTGELEIVDAQGGLITPGLIDIHIHGALGHTFNEPTDQAFEVILRENARRGVTALLATTATDAIANLAASLACAKRWMAEQEAGLHSGCAQLLGAHVEGPYFAPSQAGAQDPAHLRHPDDGTAEELLEFAECIRIMTYAPELPGALALTERLVELGIVAAAGHSAAREEEVAPVIDAGLSHMIHLWSAQSTIVREGPWRKLGLLEVSLAYDDLTAEIICDNRHLPPTLMKLAYKCIGPDRLCAISDATSGAGLPDGAHFRMGGMEYEVCDGVGMLFDRTAFAGSTTLLSQMLPILIHDVGIPVAHAVRMASLTPARVIGVADRKGSLEAGKDADLVVFDADFSATHVMIGGEWIQ
ncbi:MAG: N-acetylglucosamine-6-phosphate deacetylase [Caldilineaceae bacterium]|nr:N-acetylglucosamine-6-phosphate deacetylase [Caldilineaceae bacterium]